MRYLMVLLVVAGCAGGGRLQQAPAGNNYSSVEYFDGTFDRVVDAAYAAVSGLGMYVEDRYRSGLDQVISAQSMTMGSATTYLITIAPPTAQGVAVTITTESQSLGQLSLENEAASIFQSIAMRL